MASTSEQIGQPSDYVDRQDLAVTWRTCGRVGLALNVGYDQISLRLTSSPGQVRFLISNADRTPLQTDAADLIAIERGASAQVHIPGIPLHEAIYSRRTGVRSIIHLHSRAALAVSALECGLLPLSQTAMELFESISYSDFSDALDTPAERRRIASKVLQDHPCVLLRNHGLLAVGSSLHEAFYLAYHLELACSQQLSILSCGTGYVIPDPQLCRTVGREMSKQRADGSYRLWRALCADTARIENWTLPRWAHEHFGTTAPLWLG